MINYKMLHYNYTVSDMKKSQDFYTKWLGFKVSKDDGAKEAGHHISYLTHPSSPFEIELTSYPDGDYAEKLRWELQGEFHLAFETDEFDEAYKKHKEADIICFENLDWNLYFIADPDGNWIEILKGGRQYGIQ